MINRSFSAMLSGKWCLAALLAGCLPPALLFAGKCCETNSAEAGCSGCIKIGVDPPSYVSVGTNASARCRNTTEPLQCTNTDSVCVTYEDATVYGDAKCKNVIGSASITLFVPMCDTMDDSCNSG